MPYQRISLVGLHFGKLTVLADAEPRHHRVRSPEHRSLCLCECGNKTIVRNSSLNTGNTRSCGCLKQSINLIHGQSRKGAATKAYYTWKHINQRCYNPNVKRFDDYGGRGITVCPEWLHDFPKFFSDMGEGKAGWSIERVNNNGNYELWNCVWATPAHQNRNTRHNVVVTVRGKTGCLADLCDYFQVPYVRTYTRFIRGWGLERSFFQKSRYKHSKAKADREIKLLFQR